ncbi:MAG: carboxypeptidase-like regulatory domain-containing protein, partial [Terriglobia bacterium]
MTRVSSIVVAVLGIVFAAHAGEIRGRVLTPQGVPVADAWIRVEKEENELHRAVLTRADGSYAIPDLEQGVYAVRITGPEGQPSLLRYVVVGTPDSSVRI